MKERILLRAQAIKKAAKSYFIKPVLTPYRVLKYWS